MKAKVVSLEMLNKEHEEHHRRAMDDLTEQLGIAQRRVDTMRAALEYHRERLTYYVATNGRTQREASAAQAVDREKAKEILQNATWTERVTMVLKAEPTGRMTTGDIADAYVTLTGTKQPRQSCYMNIYQQLKGKPKLFQFDRKSKLWSLR